MISVNLVKHVYYDWVMFRGEQIQHPDENPVLGRYLVPAVDVDRARTDKPRN